MKDKPRVLEMFSGSGSFSIEAEKKGFECITVDNDARFDPTFCRDVRSISFVKGFASVIWASPPCQCFSVASISTHWTGGIRAYEPKTKECIEALALLVRGIQIIKQVRPDFWFIENPRGVMRKVIDDGFKAMGIKGYKRETVTYCQYGDGRMKPTDIWTNCFAWKPKPMCKNGDSCHERAPRGAKTGTQGLERIDRSRIPSELCKEILNALDKL